MKGWPVHGRWHCIASGTIFLSSPVLKRQHPRFMHQRRRCDSGAMAMHVPRSCKRHPCMLRHPFSRSHASPAMSLL